MAVPYSEPSCWPTALLLFLMYEGKKGEGEKAPREGVTVSRVQTGLLLRSPVSLGEPWLSMSCPLTWRQRSSPDSFTYLVAERKQLIDWSPCFMAGTWACQSPLQVLAPGALISTKLSSLEKRSEPMLKSPPHICQLLNPLLPDAQFPSLECLAWKTQLRGLVLQTPAALPHS